MIHETNDSFTKAPFCKLCHRGNLGKLQLTTGKCWKSILRVTLLPAPAMYKIKQDPHVFLPGSGYGWTGAVAMKRAYIYTSRVL